MSNFARIINNVAVDVSHDPENHFHPDIAAQFESVPDEVCQGWRLVDGTWTAPEPVVTEPSALPNDANQSVKVSPVEFKLLFTSQERVAIKQARASDLVIDDFFDIVDDPRLTSVDLGLQSTHDAIVYLIDAGLIASDRKAEILGGIKP